MHGRTEGLHHRPPVRLLVVGGAHLPDLALEVELGAGERQRRAPLPGTGLGRQLRDARLRVVVRLRHRGVRLVGTGRAGALVLVVDPGRGAEGPLQAVRPVQRRRPPQPVDVEDLVGDRDVAVGGDLLRDEVHREQRRQVVGTDRLVGPRVQRRGRRLGQVGDDVVPGGRHLVVAQQVAALLGHRVPPGSLPGEDSEPRSRPAVRSALGSAAWADPGVQTRAWIVTG